MIITMQHLLHNIIYLYIPQYVAAIYISKKTTIYAGPGVYCLMFDKNLYRTIAYLWLVSRGQPVGPARLACGKLFVVLLYNYTF